MLCSLVIITFFIEGAHGITCAANNPCLNEGTCSEPAATPGQLLCTCKPDYGGAFCQIAQPCTPDPCKNGAVCKTCQDPNGCGGGYACVCPPGFNGVHCEYQPCDPNPCQNGGTCNVTASPKGYVCTCPPSWVGTICTVQCEDGFCYNGGTCSVAGGVKHCVCPLTHVGTHCEYRNWCVHNTNLCLHNGTCLPVIHNYTLPNDSMSDYCCHCVGMFKGALCEIPGCPASFTCEHGYCALGGRKRNTCGGGTEVCVCPFEWFGDKCQYPNPCVSYPCQNGGLCVPKLCDGSPTYYCVCPITWGGHDCERKFAAECRISGDPHYITFDFRAYSNQATCRQILVKTCTNNWPVAVIPTFQIWAEHQKCWSGHASCVWRAGFDIYGKDIIMQIGQGLCVDFRNSTVKCLTLDEILFGPPPAPFDPLTISVDKCDPLRVLAITYRGHDEPWDNPGHEMVVYMGTGRISVLFSQLMADTLKPAAVNAAPKICGMCGDYDTNAENDFSGRPFNSLAFLDTFLVRPLTPAGCDPYLNNIHGSRKKRAATDPPKEFEPCTDEAGQALGKEKCGIINREDGPFGGDCYAKNPNRQKMYDACVNDVCFNITFLEDHLEAIHFACGKLEIEVGDWRTEMKLPFPCMRKQVYKRCLMRQCIPTCRNTNPCPDKNWHTSCQEGCECVEGTIWDDVSNQCIAPSKCNSTKPAFPTGFIGLGGVYNKAAAFKCCDKTEEELADMIYCQRGNWCFPEGAKLVLAPKTRSCHWRCEGQLLECMENGKWNRTHLNRKQANRSLEAQLELRQECELCAQDNCTDFNFLYILEGEEIKNCTKEEEGERLCGLADKDNNVHVECRKRKVHSGEKDHSGEHSKGKGKGHAYGLNKSSWKSNDNSNENDNSKEKKNKSNEKEKASKGKGKGK